MKQGTLQPRLVWVRCMGKSGDSGRLLIFFSVDAMVGIYDPDRCHFSDSAGIAMALLALRLEPPLYIPIIRSRVTLRSVDKAVTVTDSPSEGKPRKYQAVLRQWQRMGEGIWSGTHFYSVYLAERFIDMTESKTFKTARLGDIPATEAPSQGVRMTLDALDNSWRCTRFIRCGPKPGGGGARNTYSFNKYLIIKSGMEQQD